MANQDNKSAMLAICHRFNANMSSLRLFADRLGPIADKQDTTEMEAHGQNLARALGIEQIIKERIASHGAVRNDGQSHGEDEIRLELTDQQMSELHSLFAAIRREPPQHGRILRTSALMLAVSFLDALLAELLRFFYGRFPDSLNGEEHELTFKELCDLGSIDVAREYVMSRKVESVLRQSTKEQFRFLRSKLKVDLSMLNEWEIYLNETIQRRHIWVHNGGKVSKLYLNNVVDERMRSQLDVKEGDILPVDQSYLRRAIDRVNLAGVVISQQCWRKWVPIEAAYADRVLSDNVYDTLCDRRFVAGQYLGSFAVKVVDSSDAARRDTIINWAQAWKWAGKHARAIQIVDEHDWSSCSLRYRIAVAIIRDNESEAIELLPLALRAGDISPSHIESWPIFQAIRGQAEVQEILKQHIDETARVEADLGLGASSSLT